MCNFQQVIISIKERSDAKWGLLKNILEGSFIVTIDGDVLSFNIVVAADLVKHVK